MICTQCDNDLAKCVCPDLRERLDAIKNSKFLHIGEAYLAEIEKQAKKNEGQQTCAE